MTVERRIVIDASAAIPFVREEDGSAPTERTLRGWAASGALLAVPSLFWLEVVNVFKRDPGMTGDAVLEAVHLLDELGLETHEIDRALLILAIGGIERFGLTSYDATYLALAQRLDASLATADRRLFEAAGARGIWLGQGSARRLSDSPAAYGESRSTWPDYSGAAALLAKLRADAMRDLQEAREGRSARPG